MLELTCDNPRRVSTRDFDPATLKSRDAILSSTQAMVRITTWNVNGIRNPFGYQPWRATRSFSTMFDILEADIVIMQELKIQRKDLGDDMVLVNGWDCFFSLPKHKKGTRLSS